METEGWSCSVGTIDTSPAIYRRDTGKDHDESRKGRLTFAGHDPQPFRRNLSLQNKLPGDKSPGYVSDHPSGLREKQDRCLTHSQSRPLRGGVAKK